MFKKSFADKLSGVKSIFTKALADAKALNEEMETSKKEKEAQIESIKSEINTIDITQRETKAFITNIEKIVV